jgi:dihydrofolate synthase/folylpolyglutamate synthase
MTRKLKHYSEAIDHLYNLQKGGIKLGLANTRNMLRLLDNPQISFNSVHIAGTNGKGSTAESVASILRESGFRVGLYTSPHLVSFTERIRIDRQKISREDVIELTAYIRSIMDGSNINPTFFEFVTVMALFYFASKKIDWAVVETGMGGRFDSTNVILPVVSVITNVSIEHSEYLGSSLADITAEKAGIIKPHVPVVTAAGDQRSISILADTAQGLNAGIHIYGRHFRSRIVSMDNSSTVFDYRGFNDYRGLTMPVAGRHQLYNASLAIRACEILKTKRISIPQSSLSRGLLNVHVEGRFEKVSEKPFIILDSAHNPGAADALAHTIDELFPDRRIILVIGVMKDKNVSEIMQPLLKYAETVILTRPGGERAAAPEELHAMIVGLQRSREVTRPASILKTDSVAEALRIAEGEWSEKSVILVTGSFYTTGEAKEALGHSGVLSTLRE